MIVNLQVRYYLGLLMYKNFMTGCCSGAFWTVCRWKHANAKPNRWMQKLHVG